MRASWGLAVFLWTCTFANWRVYKCVKQKFRNHETVVHFDSIKSIGGANVPTPNKHILFSLCRRAKVRQSILSVHCRLSHTAKIQMQSTSTSMFGLVIYSFSFYSHVLRFQVLIWINRARCIQMKWIFCGIAPTLRQLTWLSSFGKYNAHNHNLYFINNQCVCNGAFILFSE